MLTPKPRRHLDLTTVTLTNMLLFPHATLNVERVAAYWTRLCGVGERERGCGEGGHACAPRMQGKYCRLCVNHTDTVAVVCNHQTLRLMHDTLREQSAPL